MRNDFFIKETVNDVMPAFKQKHADTYQHIKPYLNEYTPSPEVRAEVASIKSLTPVALVVHDLLCEQRINLQALHKMRKAYGFHFKDGFVYKERAIEEQELFRDTVLSYLVEQNDFLSRSCRKKIKKFVLNPIDPFDMLLLVDSMRQLREKKSYLLLNLIIDPEHYFPAKLIPFELLNENARELVTLSSFKRTSLNDIAYA